MTKSNDFVTSNLNIKNSAENTLFHFAIKNLICVIIPDIPAIGYNIYHCIEHAQNMLFIFIGKNTINIICMVFFNPFELVMQRHNLAHYN